VWVCPGSSVLKGTKIGEGSIVGRQSLVTGGDFPSNSLIAGTPAKVIKSNCKWKCELP
jgi:acetyltransferase-like isoleucine patch superfamily enzyme